LTGKGHFIQNPEHLLAFDIMKAMITNDCMLHCPNHNKPFHIYTDASNYQLGTIIVQEALSKMAFMSPITLANSPTLINTFLEKEHLSIFMPFKAFETMLLGADIIIHGNHKNLTFTTAFNDHVICQLNFVEWFNPMYLHIAGDDNFLADMFSHLSRLQSPFLPLRYGYSS
jgi:hypothetical protein